MENLQFIEYEEKYNNDFKRLSYEWLEKYALTEPEDVRILNNPKKLIIDRGGQILFAKYGSEIIGTISLIKVEEGVYELAKLGVTEKYQGFKIGGRLTENCLELAKEKNASKIILYSNKKLKVAIELYKKFGFKEIPIKNCKYVEADFKMELEI